MGRAFKEWFDNLGKEILGAWKVTCEDEKKWVDLRNEWKIEIIGKEQEVIFKNYMSIASHRQKLQPFPYINKLLLR